MKSNKKLMALVVAGIFALPVAAQEQSSLVDTNQIKRDAKKYDRLSTEVSLLKLELERAQLTQQIAESNAAVSSLSDETRINAKTEEIRNEFADREKEKEKIIKQLEHKISQLETKKVAAAKKASKVNPLDQVFITSVRGIGNNLTGQFYVDNDIIYRRKGEKLTADIFIENITANGALLRTKTDEKLLSVTTIEQAHFKVKKQPAMRAAELRDNDNRGDRRRN